MSKTPHAYGLRCQIVKSAKGEAYPAAHCDIAFPGGTLGRSPDNDLVLPDQRQEIASLQAIIHIAGSGQNQICNRGAMTIYLNGRSVERGQQRALNDGDRIEIGAYVIQFSELQPATAERDSAPALAGRSNDSEVPGEIWAALDAEFASTSHGNSAARSLPVPDPLHPLLQTNAIGYRPDNPLILDGGNHGINDAQSHIDIAGLFIDDHPLMQTPIMADTTPSVLVSAAHRVPAAGSIQQHPLVMDTTSQVASGYAGTLIDNAAVGEPDFDASETPLSLLLSTAVPLATVFDDADLIASDAATRDAPRTPVAHESPLPPVAGLSRDREPKESLRAPLAQDLLDGLGLGQTADLPIGSEQLHLAGRLLRLFADGMVQLLAADRTSNAEAGSHVAPENALHLNPFFALPSGDRVVMALLQQQPPKFAHPDDAITQAFAHLNARLLRTAAIQDNTVDAVLQRLAPGQLEIEATAGGLRTASAKTKQAALWTYFVQQHARIAAEENRGIAHPFGDQHQSPDNGLLPDNDTNTGTQIISAMWNQKISPSRTNTKPGTQPMYGLQWGYGK